jgi:hypothetical protein
LIMIWKCSQYAQSAFQFTFNLLRSFTVAVTHSNIQFMATKCCRFSNITTVLLCVTCGLITVLLNTYHS